MKKTNNNINNYCDEPSPVHLNGKILSNLNIYLWKLKLFWVVLSALQVKCCILHVFKINILHLFDQAYIET